MSKESTPRCCAQLDSSVIDGKMQWQVAVTTYGTQSTLQRSRTGSTALIDVASGARRDSEHHHGSRPASSGHARRHPHSSDGISPTTMLVDPITNAHLSINRRTVQTQRSLPTPQQSNLGERSRIDVVGAWWNQFQAASSTTSTQVQFNSSRRGVVSALSHSVELVVACSTTTHP